MQKTEQSTQSYTVTKYDAAKQMGERPRSVPLYWFDAVGPRGNELILGISHADGSPVAEIDDLDMLWQPTDATTVQKLGGHAFRAAAANLHEQGATTLRLEEPSAVDIHALLGAFGKEHVIFDPPLAEVPTLAENTYMDTAIRVDLDALDMKNWPKAQLFES